jgi:hypothetical protein
MYVAQGLDPAAFPLFPRLPANLASTEGFPYGGFDALANGVIRIIDVDSQPAEFLLHLQDFKLASACFVLELGDPWFQVAAESPEDVEPTILMLETE